MLLNTDSSLQPTFILHFIYDIGTNTLSLKYHEKNCVLFIIPTVVPGLKIDLSHFLTNMVCDNNTSVLNTICKI